MRWYERDPARLEREIAEYERRRLNLSLDTTAMRDQGLVVFSGSVSAEDGEHRLRVVYPHLFPEMGVQVFDYTRQYRRHQNPNERNLCLPEPKAEECGADKVLQAVQLFGIFHSKPESIADNEVPAPEPISTWYRYTHGCHVLLPEALLSSMNGRRGRFTLTLMSPGHTPIVGLNQAALVAVQDANGDGRKELDLGPLGAGTVIEGEWVSALVPPPFGLESYTQWADWACGQVSKLKHWIDRRGTTIGNGERVEAFGVVYPEEGPYKKHHVQMQICVRITARGKSSEHIYKPHILPAEDTFFERMPFLKGLKGKRVVVLGLGAIGSPVAVNLVRAGISRFVLADCDDLRPGNVVRHTEDLRAFGLPKTSALFHHMQFINPFVECELINHRIGAAPLQPDLTDSCDMDALETIVAESDLVVSGIAQPAIEHWLNEVSISHAVPAIYTGVFYGAWGGQVFRYGGTGACLRCYEKSDFYAAVSRPAEEPPLFLDGCNDPTFPGAGFDTSAVANLATRMAVQTLLNDEGYPGAQYNLINWSSRGATAGPYPQIELVTVEPQPDCPTCASIIRA